MGMMPETLQDCIRMTLLLLLVAFIGVDAQRPGYGGEGYQQQGVSLPELVDILDSLLTTRENVENFQFTRVSNLKGSVNNNLGFVSDVNGYLVPAFFQEQYQQNIRLDGLEAALERIVNLNALVTELTQRADDISEVVAEEREQNKNLQFDVNCLVNSDTARFNRIEIIQQRVGSFPRLTLLPIIAFEDFRFLQTEETNVRRLIDSVNRQRYSPAAEVNLRPNSDNASTTEVIFEPSFIGEPHYNLANPTGFYINNPHNYALRGYPTIYFTVEEQVCPNSTHVTSSDRSSGNWDLEQIDVRLGNIYFDNFEYLKSDLDGIVADFPWFYLS